jgi:proton-coupled amino acid transporter
VSRSCFCALVGQIADAYLEGIGLIIPITDAMKEPRKFPKVLSGVMISLICECQVLCQWPVGINCGVSNTTVLFGGAGALAYSTFGDQIQTVVIVNLDPRKKMVQAVRLTRIANLFFLSGNSIA